MTYLWITHPETGGVALVSDEAHREVWEPRGWQPVPIDLAAASTAFGAPVVRPEQVTETYVRGLLAAQSAPPAVEAEPTPAAAPAPETTTSTRRTGRTKAEETV